MDQIRSNDGFCDQASLRGLHQFPTIHHLSIYHLSSLVAGDLLTLAELHLQSPYSGTYIQGGGHAHLPGPGAGAFCRPNVSQM